MGAWVGKAEWVSRRGRGGDPTCDSYWGNGEPSFVAKVRMYGIVLPMVSYSAF